MGKGKLKEALINNKVKKQAENEKKKKLQKEKEAMQSADPKPVTNKDFKAKLLVEQEAKKAKESLNEESVEEKKLGLKQKSNRVKDFRKIKAVEYQSNALSKKDQRKLKKAIQDKSEQEESLNKESEDEEAEKEEGEEDLNVEISEENDSEMEEYLLDLEKLARSESESESEDENEDEDEEEEEEEEDDDEKEETEEQQEENEGDSEDDIKETKEGEEREDIPLSDVEVDSDADIVPHTKLTVNNIAALKEALVRIQLLWDKHSFQEHQSITSLKSIEPEIKDIYDDTERELAFYKQSLEAVLEGRSKLLKLKVPFTRPQDFFAEMVKSDEHMDKLKAKLIKEASEKKASVEARRQRELKKFGKQVQNATLQERQKQKRDTLERIKGLKRKRQNDEISGDAFDIAIEEATADADERKNKDKRQKPNAKRIAKNAKYGQGGMKRFKRKNDVNSSADISDFSTRKMKGKSAKRPGKSKRNRG